MLYDDIEFRHSVPVQLRFNDADALGHINNTIYYSFYDLGKTSYFQTVRGQQFLPENIDVVIAHAEVDFVAPVFLTDHIIVQTAVNRIGTKSFDLVQRIVTEQGEVKCVCRSVMVGYDFQNNCSKVISDAWRKGIEQFEGRKF